MSISIRHLTNLVPMLLAFGLIHCGTPGAPPSNLEFDGTQAEEAIKVRLKKTGEIRKNLRKFVEALSKIESTIRTAAYEISVRVDLSDLKEPAQERLPRFISELRDRLRELNREMVRTNADGSWELSRRINHVEISLFGGLPGMSDNEMVLMLFDHNTQKELTLGTLLRTPDGRTVLNFFPAELQKLVEGEYASQSCTLNIGSNDAELSCTPFIIVSGNFQMDIAQTRVRLQNGAVTDFLFSGTISDEPPMHFRVEAHENSPLQVEVTRL